MRPSLTISTSKVIGASIAAAREKIASADRTVFEPTVFVAATIDWASTWLPSTMERAPPSL